MAYLGVYIGACQLHKNYALNRYVYLDLLEFAQKGKKYYFMLFRQKLIRSLMVLILSMFCWSPIWFIQNYESWLVVKYFDIFIALISWIVFFVFNFLVFLYFERLCEWIKMDLNLFE